MQQLATQPNLAIMPTDKVVEYFLSQQSEGTSRTYGSALKGFIAWTNSQDYRTITPFQALDFDAHLKSTCSPATVQRQIATLKMFFKFAMECGLLDKNPFALIKQRGVPSRVAEKFLTPKEINRLLIALRKAGEKHFILGLILASTGLRISEAQSLSWSSFIEMPDQTISINVLRKGNEYQLLPLREDVWTYIKQYMRREVDQGDHSPLFLNPSLQRVASDSLRTWIVDGGKRAGISRRVNPHLLRHSFATTALDRGADLRDLSWYLNHKSLVTTGLYAHPTNKKVGEFIKLDI